MQFKIHVQSNNTLPAKTAGALFLQTASVDF